LKLAAEQAAVTSQAESEFKKQLRTLEAAIAAKADNASLSELAAKDPKEDVAPARSWAIDVIKQRSGVNFSAEDRAALLHKPILSKGNFSESKTDRYGPNIRNLEKGYGGIWFLVAHSVFLDH